MLEESLVNYWRQIHQETCVCTIWIRRIFWVESRYRFKSIRFPSTYLPICINKKSLNHYVQVMCYIITLTTIFFFFFLSVSACVYIISQKLLLFFDKLGEIIFEFRFSVIRKPSNVIESGSWLKNYNARIKPWSSFTAVTGHWCIIIIHEKYVSYHMTKKTQSTVLSRLLVLSILSRLMSIFLIHFTLSL